MSQAARRSLDGRDDRAAVARPPVCSADGLVSSAYGQISPNTREAFSVKVFPSGILVTRNTKCPIQPPKGYVRGTIDGFSAEASRRLREFCVTQEAKGLDPYSTTLTVHRPVTPEQWRAIMKRFRQRLLWNGWAGVWRVELQKRKVPHVHVALWLPPGVEKGHVIIAWCECTGEIGDVDALMHSVHMRKVESSGWAVYLALHDGKHKESQLGWQGKQWGVWNRDRFTARVESPLSRELPVAQEVALRRFIGRLMRSKGSRARVGRAGFLRCMEGRTVERFLAGWDAGTIGPANDER